MTTAPEDRFAERLADHRAAITPGASHDARRVHFLDLLRDAFGVDLAHFQIEERVYRGRVDALLGTLVFEFKRDLAAELEDAQAQLQRYIADLRARHPGAAFTAVATDGLHLRAFSPTYADDGLQVTGLTPIEELDLSQGTDPRTLFLRLDALIAHFREGRLPATAQTVVAALGEGSAAFRTAHAALARLYRRLETLPSLQVRLHEWRRYLALVYGEEVGDEALFLKHTYLATVARLVAWLRLSPVPVREREELAPVILGRAFEEQGVAGFIEDDFFTWFLASAGSAQGPGQGLGPAMDDGLDLAWRLLTTLQRYDFSQVREDVLKELYQGLVDPEARHDLGEYYTPDWLAELILRDELRLPQDPHRSLLDPACGSGTFLFIAIRLMREALERAGVAPSDILVHVLERVVGMDVHPLAVTIARTNYLLALGDLLQTPRDEVTIPVYLADSIKLPDLTAALGSPVQQGSPSRRVGMAGESGVSPESASSPSPLEGEGDRGGEGDDPPYTIETGEPNVFLQLPRSLVLNPRGLDYLIPKMKDKYGWVALKATSQQAWERAWQSFHQFLITPETSRKPFALSPDAAEVVVRTQQTLVRLMHEGKDTVWFAILRNALRPVSLAQQRFDLVVGNPPWLSLRYLRSPRYQQWVRQQVLVEYRLLEKGKPHLFTQMELATLFFARAADLYLREGGAIAFVMPRSVLVAQQHARFTGMSFKEGGLLLLGLRRVLDLEGVKPLFKVPACVLVAEKGRWPQEAEAVEGRVFTGDLVVKNRSLAQARGMLAERPVRYRRMEGRLAPEGEAAPLARGRSFYYDRFYQGATIVPRNLWFVRLVAGRLGFSREAPYFETDEEQARTAKAPWRDVRMAGQVEARFLYATLPSGHLVPFGYTRPSPVILPLVEEGGRYTLLNAEGAQERGFHRLAEWLRGAQGHWERLARRGPEGQPKEPSVVKWLNYRNKLTRQSPQRRYRVLYNAAGTNLAASVVDMQKLRSLESGQGVPFRGFLVEHKLWLYETINEAEGHYLTALLNSPIFDKLLKPLQTHGLWGERDIEKRPMLFPIPQFNLQDPAHARLAELGRACVERVQEVLPELSARYRSVGRLWGEVRRLLQQELAEIDALARAVLGVEG